jgi:hypothetical protein
MTRRIKEAMTRLIAGNDKAAMHDVLRAAEDRERVLMARPTPTEPPQRMTRELRLALIRARIASASDEALSIIETHLGLTPRRESPDAGRPMTAVIQRGERE